MLQSEILKSEDFLSSTFTKAELEKLCLAYKCPFDKKKLSENSTSEKLLEVIPSSESMLQRLEIWGHQMKVGYM